MLRTIRRAVTVVAACAAVTVAAASGASADVNGADQMQSATLVNLQDISDATFAQEQDGDGTCANPVVVAGPLTPAKEVVVGETYGYDVAEAVAHCMSYQGGSTPATLTVSFEYQPYSGAAFIPMPDCYTASTTSPAIAGAHVLTSPVMTCKYEADSPAAGRPHRAHAVLTYAGRAYHGYSPVYLDSYSVKLSSDVLGRVIEKVMPPCCPEISAVPAL